MDVKELVSQFESLGDNCEFGVVQRYIGIEPLGFFRWSWTPLPALLDVLDAEFANVDPERIEIYTGLNQEYMVRLQPWGFQYHTHQQDGSIDPDRLRAQQVKVVTFLKRKMLDDLRAGEKIFVRKGPDTGTLDPAMALHERLQRFGRNTLLWVVPEDDHRGPGTVEVLRPGLLKAHIDRLAPVIDAYDCSPVWLDICRHALGLHRSGSLPGSVVTRPRGWSTNLLRLSNIERDSGWWATPAVETRTLDGEAAVDPGAPVKAHRLAAATQPASGTVCGYTVLPGPAEGALYCGSLYVRIPSGSAVRTVGAVLRGVPSLALANADLALRDVWQRVWVCGRTPAGEKMTTISLFMEGDAGAVVETTCWQLETGPAATPYVSSRFGSMRSDFRIRLVSGQVPRLAAANE